MKGFGMLLLYFFTWRSVIVGSVLAGTAAFAVALSIATLSMQAAAVATLLAFVLLFVVPYLAAPKALRGLISNRRLAMVPRLPLQSGLSMLMLTVLTATFLPLAGRLFGAPATFSWLAAHIFIVASLYTLVTQLLVTSPYVWVHAQWLPIALMVLLSFFGETLLRLASDPFAVLPVAAATFAGWLYFLARLARRPNFAPAYATDVNMADQDTNSMFSAWVNRGTRQLSPVTSLILGYPANRRSRLVNMVVLLVFSPLLSVLLVKFIGRNEEKQLFAGTELFLSMSLLTSLIAGSIAWAETGARARLLWLRVAGTRTQIWEVLERDLWDYFLLLLIVTAAAVAVTWSYGGDSLMLLHYTLLLFSLTYFQRYLPLAARLHGWSSLAQALARIAALAAIGFTLVVSLRLANFNLAFLLEACFVLLGTLFRTYARFGFLRADWQVLRPQPSKRAEANA